MTRLHYPEATVAFARCEALLRGSPGGRRHGDHWLELMLDGRADLHIIRLEPTSPWPSSNRSGRCSRSAAPRRGGRPSTGCTRCSGCCETGLRVSDEDVADRPAAVTVAEHTRGQGPGSRHPVPRSGRAGWRGYLPEAEPSSPTHCGWPSAPGNLPARRALLTLTLTALRRHDTEAVRALLPPALAALRETGDHAAGRIARGMACAAWLAWQDGRPDEVIRLAAEIEERELPTFSSGAMYRWVYLFPLLAARLRADELDAAVAAARQLIDPSQMRLPDDLTSALAAACESWADGKRTDTEQHLATALALASANAYF